MKLRFFVLSGTLVASLCLAQSSFAQERVAQWDYTYAENSAFAFDCRNCEEDIGVSITCFKGSDSYSAEFLFLEQRDDAVAGKPAVVEAKIGSQDFSFEGKFSQPGLVGPYPVVEIKSDDAFFKALSKGDVLEVSTKSASGMIRNEVSLKGSSRAIKQLKAFCSAK
ncbi:MAG: hypothetical protein JKY99_10285 [Rhizobiales bacterium]|nr:hypothetical protein [Hyphomicrobiales bacterium]